MKAVVDHDRRVGAPQELAAHVVEQHGRIQPAELARQRQAMQVELADLVEDRRQPRRKLGLAVGEAHAGAVELGGVRRDLLRREGADHLGHLAVEGDRLGGGRESVGLAEALLGEPRERRPVDPLVQVVAKVGVVVEEARHAALVYFFADACAGSVVK